MLTNISANHEDTRFIMNRGLIVADDKLGGLGVIGMVDSAILESVDNKQMVRNLCFPQKCTSWSHFLSYTCNQRTRFGTYFIKNWIYVDWKMHYSGFYYLELY